MTKTQFPVLNHLASHQPVELVKNGGGYTLGQSRFFVLKPDSSLSTAPDFDHQFFRKIGKTIFIPKGYHWDGCTYAPDLWFVEASLPHDVLCQAISCGLLHKGYKKQVDELFLDACYLFNYDQTGLKRELIFFVANLYYKAVRFYSRMTIGE